MSILRLLGLVGLSAFFVGCGGDVENPLGDPGTTLWERRFGRDTRIAQVGLAGVASGGVIVSGRQIGDVDLGGGTLPGPGNNYQAYVARYGSGGEHIYSRSFGDGFAEVSNDVDAYADGSAVFAGTYGFSFELDGVSLPWDGDDDVFVAKLDPTGNVVWARALGGAGGQQAIAVAAMPDGGAIVAGTTWGAVDLGIGEPQDAFRGEFVMRLDAKGEPVWVQMLPDGDGVVIVKDIAVQGDTIAVVGTFSSVLDVGLDQDLSPIGNRDGFVVAYDLDGKPRWGRVVGGAGYYDAVTSVAFTSDGGLVLTGDVEGDADLGGGWLFAPMESDDENTFLLELDSASQHRRSFLYGGDGFDRGNGIAVGKDGRVLLTGEIYGRMSFGAGSLATSEGSRGDGFVAELDAERNPVFLRRFGDGEQQVGQRAAVDGEGRWFIAGTVNGVVDFGLGPTPSSGYYETFVAAIAP